MFRPVHRWLTRTWQGRARLAAAGTTLILVFAVLLPLGGVAFLAFVEARGLVFRLGDKTIEERVRQLRISLGLDYPYAEKIRYLESSLDALIEDAKRGAVAQGDPKAAARMLDVVQQLELELAHDGELEAGAPVTDNWNELRQALQAVRKSGEDPQHAGSLAYQQELIRAAKSLRAFKVELLGGEVEAWLRELANPTSDEMVTLSSRVFAGAPGFLRSLGGATTSLAISTLLGLGVMILAVYFFLADGHTMIRALMRLSPLDDRYELELLDEFDRISRAVVVATLLSAVVQGILAGLGFWIAGAGSVFLLTMATIVCALVPFVGAATVWVPVSLWLFFYEDRHIAAILLALYGAGVVSMSDNLIKPLVLHGQSNLHPLLALLSVIGGVQAVGPIGILVGPMIVVFLQTLLNILQREMATMKEARSAH
jgi:predicted PurR-regulated permease PerM